MEAVRVCKHKNGLFLFYANSLPGRRFVMSGSVSPLPWTGNKGCIYTTIDAFMPPHRTYVEACMGSAEVFLRKKPVEKEIINDYNGDLVRFFRVLQRNENLERLIGRLFLSFNSEQIFRANKALLAEVPNILDDLTETSVIIENTQWNDFDLAVAFYENQVFSFSSTGKNFAITKKDMTKRFGRLIAACARLRNAIIAVDKSVCTLFAGPLTSHLVHSCAVETHAIVVVWIPNMNIRNLNDVVSSVKQIDDAHQHHLL